MAFQGFACQVGSELNRLGLKHRLRISCCSHLVWFDGLDGAIQCEVLLESEPTVPAPQIVYDTRYHSYNKNHNVKLYFTSESKLFLNFVLFFKFFEDISNFCGATDTHVTSDDVSSGFQSQSGSLTYSWWRHICVTHASSVTPTDLFAASMAVEPFSSMYL